MADKHIIKIRQYCVSVMVLCLMLFCVHLVQKETGWENVKAETAAEPSEEPESMGRIFLRKSPS
jgi:hypothetical protein